MLRSEFEKLTGFYPPENLFEVIQEAYTQSKLSKRDFCRQYKFNVNGLAKKIQCEVNKRACQTAYLYGMMLSETRFEVEQLQKECNTSDAKAVVKILAEILKRAGEISPEDFDAIMKQCKIQK